MREHYYKSASIYILRNEPRLFTSSGQLAFSSTVDKRSPTRQIKPPRGEKTTKTDLLNHFLQLLQDMRVFQR